MMKTLVCTSPGMFEYTEATMPEPSKDNVLIKVKNIGICGTDLHAFEGTQPYFNYPRILGHELSGILVDNSNAPSFKQGEAVTFLPYFNCNNCIACSQGLPNCCVNLKVFGVHIDGGMMEYISVPADKLIYNNGLSFEELALIEPLAIGAHAIQRAAVKQNEFVVVVGAGPIGLAVCEFAKIAGAQIIVIDVNDNRLDFCRHTLSLPFIINANKQSPTETIAEITGSDMATVVIDATGNLNAINNGINYLSHGGRYVLVGLQKQSFSFNHPEFHKREATLMSSRNATKENFEFVISCIKNKLIHPGNYITHRINFKDVKDNFKDFLNPANAVIKAMIEMD